MWMLPHEKDEVSVARAFNEWIKVRKNIVTLNDDCSYLLLDLLVTLKWEIVGTKPLSDPMMEYC